MADFRDIFTSDKMQTAIAGAAGGLVRWLTLRSDWKEGLAGIIIGGICALYLWPIAEPVAAQLVGGFVVDPSSRASFSGFLIGLGGLAVSGMVIDIWKARRSNVNKKEKPDADEG